MKGGRKESLNPLFLGSGWKNVYYFLPSVCMCEREGREKVCVCVKDAMVILR